LFDYPDDRYYFAVTAGPARLIFLDGGEDKPDSHPVYAGLNNFSEYRRAQAAWLKDEIQSEPFKQAKYRILIHHIPRPLVFPGRQGTSAQASIVGEDQIDLAICGHTHSYSYTPAERTRNAYPWMIGGGPSSGTVIVLSADAERLKVTMINGAGRVLAEHEQPPVLQIVPAIPGFQNEPGSALGMPVENLTRVVGARSMEPKEVPSNTKCAEGKASEPR
jgi:hypothetical protein